MDKIAILDFGGQYCHLISRRLKDLGVFSEIFPSDVPAGKISDDKTIRGIILSGGARSVYEKNSPKFDKKILGLGIPILGICYGHQLIAYLMGGKVLQGKSGEYGFAKLSVKRATGILAGLKEKENVWMNHRDVVTALPKSFSALAGTDYSNIAAFMKNNGAISGVQFHPEVTQTECGNKILRNFVIGICKAKQSLSASPDVSLIVKEARETIGKKKAVIGLSGGIDSSVAAMLVQRAVGKNLIAVSVDTGLLRHGEIEFVKRVFGEKLNLKIVDARKEFFRALKGVTIPEQKRKIIGKLFVNVFDRVAKKEKAEFLVQGTIYSDRIESGLTKHSSVIKSHHNVGGLPKDMTLKVYEPLRDFYKDEVRGIAKAMRLPQELSVRQVFPGPGLAIRIIGEVTPEKAAIAREAMKIVEEELQKTKFWKQIYMAFPVLLSIKSTGVQGDARSYKYPIALRIIGSKDVMTASFLKIPFPILEKISIRITNEIKEVNRVVYDITNKPPGTMEWE